MTTPFIFDDDVSIENTNHTHVWQAAESAFAVYAEDANGNVSITGTPIMTFPFVQNVSINGVCKIERRQVTGRARKKLCQTEPYEFSASCEDLYLDRKIQLRLNDVFKRGGLLRVVFSLASFEYLANSENEVHCLKHVFAGKFTVQSQDANTVKVNAEFEAEAYENDIANW